MPARGGKRKNNKLIKIYKFRKHDIKKKIEATLYNKQYRCSGVIRSASGDKSAFRYFQRWTETRSKIPADTILRRVDKAWLRPTRRPKFETFLINYITNGI
jgi:hypothetical protein